MTDGSVTDASATKRWQVRVNHLAMRQGNDKVRQCRFAEGADASFGHRGSLPGVVRRRSQTALLLTAAILMPANAANADPGIGPTAVGLVEISISVAPQYRLLAREAPGASDIRKDHANRPCLATNSSAPLLPVMLVRPSTHRSNSSNAGPPGNGSATEIRSCGKQHDQSAPLALNPTEHPESPLVLVRPD